MSAEQVLRVWFDRLWTRRDPSVIDELFVPAGRATGLHEHQAIGPKEFHAFFQLMTGALAETRCDIEQIMTHGEHALVLLRFQGRHVASGKGVDVHVGAHARIVDGKIVEATNVIDFLGLLQQIGELPADVLVTALSK